MRRKEGKEKWWTQTLQKYRNKTGSWKKKTSALREEKRVTVRIIEAGERRRDRDGDILRIGGKEI